jgi:hypothetical protein
MNWGSVVDAETIEAFHAEVCAEAVETSASTIALASSVEGARRDGI